MNKITLLSRNYTPFLPNKELDEEAYRLSLRRMLDSEVVVYLASGGSGEANALSDDEVRRLYELGVEELGGKIPVYANLPEVVTASEAIRYAQMAIEAGTDAVNLYGPAGLHGYKPTDLELLTYFDEALSAIDYPVVVAPNPIQGYTPTPKVIATVCDRYEQVEGVNLVGIGGDRYFLELLDLLSRDVKLNVPLPGSLQSFTNGASGLISNLCNLVPKTLRHYLDLYEAGNFEELGEVYAGLQRLSRYVEGGVWHGPRWQKAALQILGLPGGEGGVRLPYMLPPEADVQAFAAGLLAIGLPEIDDLARAAGIAE